MKQSSETVDRTNMEHGENMFSTVEFTLAKNAFILLATIFIIEC